MMPISRIPLPALPAALVLLAAGPPVLAQTDGAAAGVPLRAAEPAERQQQQDRWAVSIDLGFASSRGNSDLTSLTSGVRLKHLQTRAFKLEWGASFRYGESQGEVVARNLQSKLDFDVGPSARVSPFVFASAEHDPFRKLDLRARTGSGVKYTFYREDAGELSLRVAAQYSRENFTAAASQKAKTDGAWSMQFNGAHTLGDNLRMENVTTWDPVFDDFGDHTLEMRSKVSSRVTRRLALTLTHHYTYDSTPALNVGRSDQRFTAGLTIDL